MIKLLLPSIQFPIKYRGAEITHSAGYCGGYDWVHEDSLDASYDEGSWSIWGCGFEYSINACKEAIDQMHQANHGDESDYNPPMMMLDRNTLLVR